MAPKGGGKKAGAKAGARGGKAGGARGRDYGGKDDWYWEGSKGQGGGGGRDYGDGYWDSTWNSNKKQEWGQTPLNSSAIRFQPGALFGGLGGGFQEAAAAVWSQYFADDGVPYYYNRSTGLTQWERPAELDPPKVAPAVQPSFERPVVSRPEGGGRVGRDGRDGAQKGRGRGGAGRGRGGGKGEGKKQEDSDFGPPGCNLFVFHLPDDWTDSDMQDYFSPHGNIVSAKVMKELGTGRSRGFGFVSYEDRVAAATAVKKMQGYKILGKRLKVEFKKGEGGDDEAAGDHKDGDDGGGKKNYPDDERLIGYLRAISAKNVVQSLTEQDAGADADAAGARHNTDENETGANEDGD